MERKKAPRETLNPLGALVLDHSGKFSSPILQKKKVKLLSWLATVRAMTMPKYQNPPFGSIGKCQESCQLGKLPDPQHFFKE